MARRRWGRQSKAEEQGADVNLDVCDFSPCYSVTRTALILQPLVAATGWRLKGVQRWLSAAGYVVG